MKSTSDKELCASCGKPLHEVHGSLSCANECCGIRGQKQVACCEGGAPQDSFLDKWHKRMKELGVEQATWHDYIDI